MFAAAASDPLASPRSIRFLVTGIGATLLYALLAAAFSTAMSPVLASLFAYALAATFSYAGHTYFNGAHRLEVPRFAVLTLVGLAMSFVLPLTLSERLALPAWIPIALTCLLVALINYVVLRHWAFGKALAEPGSVPRMNVLQERLPAIPVLLTLLVAVYAAWLAVAIVPTNVDVSWLLVVCDRLLNGEHLHTDIVEINPPFSVWMYMPFMFLERLTGGRAELWLILGVIGLALASLAFSARILARADPIYFQPRFIWVLPAAFLLIVCFQPHEFGQREHFSIIAILPWIALQCARQRASDFAAGSRLEQMLAGVCAAIVVMVKPPHFALAFVLPAALLAIQRRSLKPLLVPENITGAAIVAFYVAYIVVFQTQFITEILPLARDVYLPAREPLLALLDWPRELILLAIATVLLADGFQRMHWDAKIPLLAAFGLLPAFLIMGKGWPNHAMPMIVLGTLAFGMQLLHGESPGRLKLIGKTAAIFGCFLVLQLTAKIQWFTLTNDYSPLERSIASIQQVDRNPTIVSLAARLQVAHPLSRRVGGHFVSRYPSASMVFDADKLAETGDDPQIRRRLADIRDRMIGQLADEIATKRPDIVLYGDETGPDWGNLMLRDPRIALELHQYSILHQEPGIRVYFRKHFAAGGEAAK
ncbi:GtrA family protein [Mesorhizobium sp. CA4]|uniref:GtrA family protein n=1 Tax=Mesorhizobium sp. CA4 TaxID=588499 RepID=UPI001CD0BB56|nr:GtrA family protein [Mesorhizobium sp. CA4]MBZ9818196.1 GtrA family protein [Mesorhizobium sp. CA4]